MAIVVRKNKRSTVYWVVTKGHAERVGLDKREAERLNARRKKEVKAGTYSAGMSPSSQVGTFLREWLEARDGRSARIERAYLVTHIFGRDWFMKLRMDDVAPKHVQKLVEEIKLDTRLAHKTISNIVAVLRTAFRQAQRSDITHRDVVMLNPRTLNVKMKERVPYTVEEASALLASASGHRRVWIALALYTGMRCGEVCGRRWRDWDTKSSPLGCLLIATQYADLPLKTDNPRKAPVHPALAEILSEWKRTGFELLHCRKPKPDDFILPRYLDDEKPLSHPTAYWAWNADCRRAGVPNKTQHATRHTFVTLTRRGGADTEAMETITHNAKGTIVDNYTHRSWSELCAVVMCLPDFVPPTGGANSCRNALPDSSNALNFPAHIRASALNSPKKTAKRSKPGQFSKASEPLIQAGKRFMGATLAAGQESEATELAIALAEFGARAEVASVLSAPLAKSKPPLPYIARVRPQGGTR